MFWVSEEKTESSTEFTFSSTCVVSYVGFALWGANFRDLFFSTQSSIITNSFLDLL